MGKTVPSYRMALEIEVSTWRAFRQALPSEEDKQAFDEIMDMCRNNAAAAQNACSPILFEPMVISILLGQQKRTCQLENKLDKIKLPDSGAK